MSVLAIAGMSAVAGVPRGDVPLGGSADSVRCANSDKIRAAGVDRATIVLPRTPEDEVLRRLDELAEWKRRFQ